MLYRKWVSDELRETKYQLIVPQTLQQDILRNYHDIPSAGHLGADKMLSRIQEHFYWPAMKDKIDSLTVENVIIVSPGNRQNSRKPR